jgi:uncharacterized protein
MPPRTRSSTKTARDGPANLMRAAADRSLVAPIASLRRNPGSRLQIGAVIEAHDLAVSGSHVPEGSPVSVEVTLDAAHDGILVSGTVRATWEGACRRCLEPVTGELSVAVRELCVEDADHETTYPLDGDEVDLAMIVHDACILNLPLAPLCGEGCRGLCPECGVNRNVETCACAGPRGARPQSALAGGGAGADPAGGRRRDE